MPVRPSKLPRYRDLPIAEGLPKGSAWGVFGQDDEIGTVNLLTPDLVRSAASLIRRGVVYPLNWRIDTPDPGIMGRKRMKRTQLSHREPAPASDEYYDQFYPQGSTQWDSLKHVGHPTYGFYNGHSPDSVLAEGATELGIHNLAQRGIVGRFVLVDVDRYLTSKGRTLAQTERILVTTDDLDAALEAEGVKPAVGDILLIRFGWITWYERLDRNEREKLASVPAFPAPGLSAEERTAEWLWDHHFAAVASDVPALEATPLDKFELHYRIVPLLGLAVGEMFDLDKLADDCASTSTYEGFFAAAPLNLEGGSGSTGNALAIK